VDRREINTPLGVIVLSASGLGLTGIEWQSGKFTSVEGAMSNPHLDRTEKWIDGYFRGQEMPLPTLDGAALTKFQFRVCKVLMEHAPFGQTATYASLARAVKSPGASRAVGSVMARQPWPILVPCHRVLKSDGQLGNYSAADGVITKKWLLNHESQRYSLG